MAENRTFLLCVDRAIQQGHPTFAKTALALAGPFFGQPAKAGLLPPLAGNRVLPAELHVSALPESSSL
jgi:hypothetical protein